MLKPSLGVTASHTETKTENLFIFNSNFFYFFEKDISPVKQHCKDYQINLKRDILARNKQINVGSDVTDKGPENRQRNGLLFPVIPYEHCKGKQRKGNRTEIEQCENKRIDAIMRSKIQCPIGNGLPIIHIVKVGLIGWFKIKPVFRVQTVRIRICRIGGCSGFRIRKIQKSGKS
jgi:hypothetical protein